MLHCIALVTIVCFLAEIRCHFSDLAHTEYLTAILTEMKKPENGPIEPFEIDQTNPMVHHTKKPKVNAWCFWVRMFGETRTITDDTGVVTSKGRDTFEHEEQLAYALHAHIRNYFHDKHNRSPYKTICFERDGLGSIALDTTRKPQVPLALQLMLFALKHPVHSDKEVHKALQPAPRPSRKVRP